MDFGKILFLRLANAARSQMAEDPARALVGAEFEVARAGARATPTRLSPLAVTAMEKPPRTTWKGTPLHERSLSDPDGDQVEINARLSAAQRSEKPADKPPVFLTWSAMPCPSSSITTPPAVPRAIPWP